MIFSDLLKIIEGKKVLFITPSDADYIRNRQEINILAKISAAFRHNSSEGYPWSKPNRNHAYFVDQFKGACYEYQ